MLTHVVDEADDRRPRLAVVEEMRRPIGSTSESRDAPSTDDDRDRWSMPGSIGEVAAAQQRHADGLEVVRRCEFQIGLRLCAFRPQAPSTRNCVTLAAPGRAVTRETERRCLMPARSRPQERPKNARRRDDVLYLTKSGSIRMVSTRSV
jgi:hypothetical protein